MTSKGGRMGNEETGTEEIEDEGDETRKETRVWTES